MAQNTKHEEMPAIQDIKLFKSFSLLSVSLLMFMVPALFRWNNNAVLLLIQLVQAMDVVLQVFEFFQATSSFHPHGVV